MNPYRESIVLTERSRRTSTRWRRFYWKLLVWWKGSWRKRMFRCDYCGSVVEREGGYLDLTSSTHYIGCKAWRSVHMKPKPQCDDPRCPSNGRCQ